MKRRGLRTFVPSLLTAYLLLLALPVALLLVCLRVGNASGGAAFPTMLFIVAGVLGIVFFGLFGGVARRFRRRFRRMIDGMNAMAAGDRAAVQGRMPIDAGDEFGRLSRAFNELQAYWIERNDAALRELQLSDRLQRRLLTAGRQRLNGFAVAAECRQTREVGGDLYDVVPLGDNRFAVLIGDVAGKGMQAALLMSAVMALFRREVRLGGSAADVLTRLNRLLYPALRGRTCVTAGLALYDGRAGEIAYAGAGHMPPYVWADGAWHEIAVASWPLGVMEDVSYRERAISLPAGAKLLLYTDGLIETTRADGTFLGFDGFAALLAELDAAQPPQELLPDLLARVDACGDGATGEADDRTAVLLERL
ncbi:MAG: SpoIIE family protein phosphatase [Paenibacillaceae bacterium]|nr:SpoIIE family protein phosphatase [Paenibacillaceae bacterium]